MRNCKMYYNKMIGFHFKNIIAFIMQDIIQQLLEIKFFSSERERISLQKMRIPCSITMIASDYCKNICVITFAHDNL